MRAPRRASSKASSSLSTGASRRSAGTGSVRVPSSVRTVITVFSLIWRPVIAWVALSTTSVSGVTWPLTMASPSPQAALMCTSPRAPVTGCAVKSTPAASAGTSSCTTTARRTEAESTRCQAR